MIVKKIQVAIHKAKTVKVKSINLFVLLDPFRSAKAASRDEPTTEAKAVKSEVRALPRTEKFLLTNV